MAFLEQHPPHVRKKIALVITGVIAAVLLGLLVLTYTHPRVVEHNSTLVDFYNTILVKGQSLFDSK